MTGSGEGKDELGERRRSRATDPLGDGTPELVSRMRHGALAAERVKIAAALGHEAARALFPDEAPISVDEALARLEARPTEGEQRQALAERLAFEVECLQEALTLLRRKVHHPTQDALAEALERVAQPTQGTLEAEVRRRHSEADRRCRELLPELLRPPMSSRPPILSATAELWLSLHVALSRFLVRDRKATYEGLAEDELRLELPVSERAAGVASLAIVEGAFTGPGQTPSEALDEARRGERARQAERLAQRLLDVEDPPARRERTADSVFDQPLSARARRRRRRSSTDDRPD